jgi:3-phosphoinositide dependent protein kinase-1
MALHGQEAHNVDLSIPASSGYEPSRSSDSPSSPVLNLLSSLSRNTSVISSSSSSSSSSSIVLAPPRPLRSFSGQSHGSRSPHNDSRTRRPHSPPSPHTPRPPNYLQRQLGLADPPEVALPPAALPDSSGIPTLLPNIAPTHLQPTRIVSSNAVKRVYSADDFEFGDVLGEGSYSTVRLISIRSHRISPIRPTRVQVLSVTHRRTGQVFALKVLDKHHLQRVNKVKYAYVEKDTLAKLSNVGHPGVVKLHWAFSDTSSLCATLVPPNESASL